MPMYDQPITIHSNEEALTRCEEDREREKTDIDDSFIDNEEEEDDLVIPRVIQKSSHSFSFYPTDHEARNPSPFTAKDKQSIESFNRKISKATDILEKKLQKKLTIYQRVDMYGNIETVITKAPSKVQLVPEKIENYDTK